jgi:hypothetical protein
MKTLRAFPCHEAIVWESYHVTLRVKVTVVTSLGGHILANATEWLPSAYTSFLAFV